MFNTVFHFWQKFRLRTPFKAEAVDLQPKVKYVKGAVVVCAVISWISVDSIIILQGHIIAENYLSILVYQISPMVQTLFVVMVSCNMTNPMFTHLTWSRTGFLNTRLISYISSLRHSHQTSLLSNRCSLQWRGSAWSLSTAAIVIWTCHSFVGERVQNSVGKHSGTVFIVSEEIASFFECQRFFYTLFGKKTCF